MYNKQIPLSTPINLQTEGVTGQFSEVSLDRVIITPDELRVVVSPSSASALLNPVRGPMMHMDGAGLDGFTAEEIATIAAAVEIVKNHIAKGIAK
jgi:hypothetical protein